MTNKKIVEHITVLLRDVEILRRKLRKTSNTQFEPNITEKRRIMTGVKACKKKISNLIFMI